MAIERRHSQRSAVETPHPSLLAGDLDEAFDDGEPLLAEVALEPAPESESGGDIDARIAELESRLQRLQDFNRQLSEQVQRARPAVSADQADTEARSGERRHALPGKSIGAALADIAEQAIADPPRLVQHCTRFGRELVEILAGRSELEPERGDKRFKDVVWKDNPFYRRTLQVYLAWGRQLQQWLEATELEGADAERAQFLLSQCISALSPSNTLLNPVAVKRAYQTGGRSLLSGLRHLLDDLEHNGGMPRQVGRSAYVLGENLASTPGEVVYRSELLELIQYRPTTESVHQRPVLLMPPQINRFYAFDLSPKNSFVRHAVEAGLQFFVISWRNPSAEHRHWNLDSYVAAADDAIDVMRDITGSEDINLVSACAGGLTASALLGLLQARGERKVHANTLLVTALETRRDSIMERFVTERGIELAKRHSHRKGYMDGRQLAHIFAWLRPDDLVWSFWVNNYLLGKEPPSLDVLFWDNDPTRLPAGLHADFLDIYKNRAFSAPGRLTVCGSAIDIGQLDCDNYLVAGSEDYLMPWRSCFDNARLLGGRCEFVLSSSGHVQSILRPPGIAHAEFHTGNVLDDDPDQWLQRASCHEGSWWPHWSQWLQQRSGPQRAAPAKLGSERHPPLCAAPGLYVLEE